MYVYNSCARETPPAWHKSSLVTTNKPQATEHLVQSLCAHFALHKRISFGTVAMCTFRTAQNNYLHKKVYEDMSFQHRKFSGASVAVILQFRASATLLRTIDCRTLNHTKLAGGSMNWLGNAGQNYHYTSVSFWNYLFCMSFFFPYGYYDTKCTGCFSEPLWIKLATTQLIK
jgi:hypothetical protein